MILTAWALVLRETLRFGVTTINTNISTINAINAIDAISTINAINADIEAYHYGMPPKQTSSLIRGCLKTRTLLIVTVMARPVCKSLLSTFMLARILGAKLMMAVLAVAWLKTASVSAMKKALCSGPEGT